MRIEILTLFPELLRGALDASLLGKARAGGLVEVELADIREHAEGRHRVCDDTPYGGGAGMVMKPEPVVRAIEAARERAPPGTRSHVVLLTPAGRLLDQARVRALGEHPHLVLVCGRYEGIDDRVRPHLDEELSVGDYILSGGEPAALVVVDAVVRLVPGVMGNESSAEEESFEIGLLEHPHYTRPPVFEGAAVPPVLLSGDHARIARWRRQQALWRTRDRRPELLERLELTEEDRALLEGPEVGEPQKG